MNCFQKGYLELNQIYFSRLEHEAHAKRLHSLQQRKQLKNSPYTSRIEEQRSIQQKIFFSHRYQDVNKWQNVVKENSIILRRIEQIKNRQVTPPSQQGTPRARNKIKENKLRIETENKRIQNRISGIQSDIKNNKFRESFLQHKKYSNQIQKFTKSPKNNQIQLRANILLDQVSKNKKINSSRTQSLHVKPGRIHSLSNKVSYTIQYNTQQQL